MDTLEDTLGEHPYEVIERLLARTTTSETMASTEVADFALDLQQAYQRWCTEDG